MFKTLADAFKIKEVRNKLILTIVLLFVYRLGCWLPIPGINTEAFGEDIAGNTFLSLLSSVSGGALSQGSFLALGVSPYITSSIIIQLLSSVIPSWQRLAKDGGADGRKKITQYTKIAAYWPWRRLPPPPQPQRGPRPLRGQSAPSPYRRESHRPS